MRLSKINPLTNIRKDKKPKILNSKDSLNNLKKSRHRAKASLDIIKSAIKIDVKDNTKPSRNNKRNITPAGSNNDTKQSKLSSKDAPESMLRSVKGSKADFREELKQANKITNRSSMAKIPAKDTKFKCNE